MPINKRNVMWIVLAILLFANFSVTNNEPIVLPHWSDSPILKSFK